MKYYQTFTVKCEFTFPIDMLRYDSCFPSTETDSGKINDSITHVSKNEEIQIGRFVINKKANPTIGRWESFQCQVSNIHTR